MKRLNNKGFTLIEVLVVIAMIALIAGIAIPNVLSSINTSKSVSEKAMIENIKTASQELYEEIEFTGNDLYDYNEKILITNNKITVHLQSLVTNGFLTGTGKNGEKILINPKTGDDIGDCQITITKTTDIDDTVSYTITNISTNNKCPNY